MIYFRELLTIILLITLIRNIRFNVIPLHNYGQTTTTFIFIWSLIKSVLSLLQR